MDDLKGLNEQDLKGLLEELNWVHVVGTNVTHVYHLLNKSRKVGGSFHDAYGHLKVQVPDADGMLKSVPRTKVWITSPTRQRADDYLFDPRKPTGFIPPQKPHDIGELNIWPGMATHAAYPAGSRERFRVNRSWNRYMRKLFGVHWRWVALWVGHMLNRPWESTSQAVMLLTSVQGIGKSLFGEMVIQMLGNDLGLEVEAKEIGAHFNALLAGKIFGNVNELDAKFDTKESVLNDMITNPKNKITFKGVDTTEFDNLMRYYFSTNSSSPCRMSPKQRRILVIEPEFSHADTRGRWGAAFVAKRIAGFKRDPLALGVIREWFDDFWFNSGEGEGVWDSHAPVPVTAAGEDAAIASMTECDTIAQLVFERMEDSDSKWLAVTSSTRSSNKNEWSKLAQMVKGAGGRYMSFKRHGWRGNIFDLGKTLEFSVVHDKRDGTIKEVKLTDERLTKAVLAKAVADGDAIMRAVVSDVKRAKHG